MLAQSQQFKDFGPKNIALVVGIAIILGALAWGQRPVRVATEKYGDSLNGHPLAMDQNNGQGQVLGATQYNQDLINQFSNIQIQTSTDTSSDALHQYADQIQTIEESDHVSELLSMDETASLKARQSKFISDMKSVAVPTVFADYDRLLLAGFDLQFQQKQGLITEDISGLLSSIQDQLTQIKNGFQTSIQVDLP